MRWSDINTETTDRMAVFSFGRFNPPTLGHQKLVDTVKEFAAQRGADAFVFTSKTHDPIKNPLDFNTKINFLRAFFPDINIVDDTYINNAGKVSQIISAFDAIRYLEKAGYTDLLMIVGDDQLSKFKGIAHPYMPSINPNVKKGLAVNINSFDVKSAGQRDPDSAGIEGISGTRARELARLGLEKEFIDLVTPNTNNSELKKQLYYEVQRGMNT